MDNSLIIYASGVVLNILICIAFPNKMKEYNTTLFVLFSWIGLFLLLGMMLMELSVFGDNWLASRKEKQKSTDAVDFMNWTLSGDCNYQCVDEDEWNGPDYMENRQTYTTREIYKIYCEKNKNKEII